MPGDRNLVSQVKSAGRVDYDWLQLDHTRSIDIHCVALWETLRWNIVEPLKAKETQITAALALLVQAIQVTNSHVSYQITGQLPTATWTQGKLR